MRRLRPELWPLAALLALLLVIFGRLLVQPAGLLVDADRPSLDEHVRPEDRVPGNDLTRLYLPHHLRVGSAVRQTGRIPGWDPAGFGGRPLVGNPQAGLWYPPVWLTWRSGTPAVLGWLTVAHLAWAGVGMLVLARSLGLGRFAAFVAAAAFAGSPYLLGHVAEGHLPHVWGAAWYPWGFWAMSRWQRVGRRAWPLLPPILAAGLLTGHPQEGFYLVLALSVWVATDAVLRWRRGERSLALTRLGAWGLAVILTLGFTAPEWGPATLLRDWLHQGTELSLGQASRYHVRFLNLFQFLSPRALGGPAGYFGRDNLWEPQLAAGLGVLILAVLAWQDRVRSAWVRGCFALVVVGLLFACGRRLGLFAVFYEVVPGVGRFRVPSRSLFLVSLGVALLAAMGLEALTRIDRSALVRFAGRYRRVAFVVAAAVGIGACVAWAIGLAPDSSTTAGAATAQVHETADDLARALLACRTLAANPVFWGALLGAGGLLARGLRPGASSRRLAVGLGLLAVAELGLEGFLSVHVASPDRFLGTDPIAAAIRRDEPEGSWRIRARDAFYPDLAAVTHGLEKTNLNDYFQLQHAADLYERLYPLFDPPAGLVRRRELLVSSPRVRRAVLDRMGVAFLVSDVPLAEVDAQGIELAGRGRWRGRDYLLYRNPTALPRAYVVPRARVAPEGLGMVALFPETPAREAVLMAVDPLDGLEGPRQAFRPASYARPDPDRVVVEVRTQEPGLLVVADTWTPGWSARVDGRPAEVLRGNRAQRVVALPTPGLHRIEMEYTPPGLRSALALTACTAVGWALLTAAALRPPRRSSTPAPNQRRRFPASALSPGFEATGTAGSLSR